MLSSYGVRNVPARRFRVVPTIRLADVDELEAREFLWRGRQEWEVRREMEAAVERRLSRRAEAIA